ncbi:MAG TPA: DUF979 domain-containing protein [Caulobacteraceae bacterium]|nr:DUF979 domain-containing protein [Caulobacteraceae bacterium]
MIGVGFAYLLAGALFAVVAVASALDRANSRRWNNAAFWGLFALSFLAGDRLGDFGNGVLVLALVAIGGFGGIGLSRPPTTTPAERQASAARWGDWLFLPVLIIPAVALGGTFAFKSLKIGGGALVDPKQATVIALALGVVIALAAAMAMLRPPLTAAPQEARRLMDSVGWAAILPQLLAALGAVFALAGVGHAVGALLGGWLPADSRLAVVVLYCLGMAIFTMIMGNAFAAFPVLTAGVGAPLIVGKFGGDPAIMGSIGMLAGYCGTLMTLMAAHNIIPTALLNLPPGAVIRAQAPTALIVLAANIALMYFLVFRF